MGANYLQLTKIQKTIAIREEAGRCIGKHMKTLKLCGHCVINCDFNAAELMIRAIRMINTGSFSS